MYSRHLLSMCYVKEYLAEARRMKKIGSLPDIEKLEYQKVKCVLFNNRNTNTVWWITKEKAIVFDSFNFRRLHEKLAFALSLKHGRIFSKWKNHEQKDWVIKANNTINLGRLNYKKHGENNKIAVKTLSKSHLVNKYQ